VCLRGRRACPPEDCGGVDGYGEMVAGLKDPPVEQESSPPPHLLHVGFDPEHFQLDEINERLKGIGPG
jgi:hypothetical protein